MFELPSGRCRSGHSCKRRCSDDRKLGLSLFPCGLICTLSCLLPVCLQAANHREHRLQGSSPGWERFSRVLAWQTCRPEFGSQNSCEKLGGVAGTCSLSHAELGGRDRQFPKAHWPASLPVCQSSRPMTDPVSNEKQKVFEA